jgi:hypothetical protein
MSKYHCEQHVLDGIRPTETKIPVFFASQIGGHPELNKGVVLKIKDELESIKPGTDIAFFLSNHGFPINKVGNYDAKSDSYHENVRKVFQSTKEAIMKTIEWSGKIEIIQVFGQFLEEKYNPNGINTRPLDALKSVADRGFQRVIDIPYEFPGDSVDALVKLRQAYGINPPTWDKNYETLFEREGIPVKICSALFHQEYRINAYFDRACEAVEQCLKKISQ